MKNSCITNIDDYLLNETKILSLAEQNSPLLLKLAKLCLPYFFSKLYELKPKLKRSELIFCIYLKLNFTTKEIATFLNVSPKAIQNRKNRFRKKLNISSDIDLTKWLDGI